MRRADRPYRVRSVLVALALVVLVGLAAPGAAAHGDLPRTGPGTGPATTTTLRLSSAITVFGLPVSARVTVPARGATTSGEVRVLVDGAVVASGRPGPDGTVRVALPASVAVGRHAVTAVYAAPSATDVPVPAAARTLTVTRTLPLVRTDGTDWWVGASDPKAIRIQVAGLAGVAPTGTVVVWLNGVRRGSAPLDRFGEAVVSLPISTKAALVVVSYAGDATFAPWIARPRLLVVR